MANHKRGEPVEWVKNKNSSVSLKLRDGKVAGCEIFNNYGGKGNESFLMSYGFALDDTSDDSYGLELGRRGEGGGVVKLGPYYIKRGGEFPEEIWKALDSNVEEEGEEEVGGVSAEAVEALLETLERRLKAFEETRERDDGVKEGGGGVWI